MGTEHQNQAKENLFLAVQRCEQEGMQIWEATRAVHEAFMDWARKENLEVRLTVVAK